MKIQEKVDMFLGMAQLKGVNIEVLTNNIKRVGVETFKNDLNTLIKGSLDMNIGNMYNLVDKYMNA